MRLWIFMGISYVILFIFGDMVKEYHQRLGELFFSNEVSTLFAFIIAMILEGWYHLSKWLLRGGSNGI